MTGTLIQNLMQGKVANGKRFDLLELWALLYFIMPRLFDSMTSSLNGSPRMLRTVQKIKEDNVTALAAYAAYLTPYVYLHRTRMRFFFPKTVDFDGWAGSGLCWRSR